MKANEGKHLQPPTSQGGNKAKVGPTSANTVGAHKRHQKPCRGPACGKGMKDCY